MHTLRGVGHFITMNSGDLREFFTRFKTLFDYESKCIRWDMCYLHDCYIDICIWGIKKGGRLYN